MQKGYQKGQMLLLPLLLLGPAHGAYNTWHAVDDMMVLCPPLPLPSPLPAGITAGQWPTEKGYNVTIATDATNPGMTPTLPYIVSFLRVGKNASVTITYDVVDGDGVAVLPMTTTTLDSVGDVRSEAEKCQCTGDNGRIALTTALKNQYGAEYGTSCSAWDMESSLCALWGAPGPQCCKSWCYVSPECPDAYLAELNYGAYFSYEGACGDAIKEPCPYTTAPIVNPCACLNVDKDALWSSTDITAMGVGYGSSCKAWDTENCNDPDIYAPKDHDTWCCEDWCWTSQECQNSKNSKFWPGLYWTTTDCPDDPVKTSQCPFKAAALNVSSNPYCKCLGWTPDVFHANYGRRRTRPVADNYPDGYGSYCKAWESDKCDKWWPDTKLDIWCCQSWCYVDEDCPSGNPSAIAPGNFWSMQSCAQGGPVLRDCRYSSVCKDNATNAVIKATDFAGIVNSPQYGVGCQPHDEVKCNEWWSDNQDGFWGVSPFEAGAHDFCCQSWSYVEEACPLGEEGMVGLTYSYETCKDKPGWEQNWRVWDDTSMSCKAGTTRTTTTKANRRLQGTTTTTTTKETHEKGDDDDDVEDSGEDDKANKGDEHSHDETHERDDGITEQGDDPREEERGQDDDSEEDTEEKDDGVEESAENAKTDGNSREVDARNEDDERSHDETHEQDDRITEEADVRHEEEQDHDDASEEEHGEAEDGEQHHEGEQEAEEQEDGEEDLEGEGDDNDGSTARGLATARRRTTPSTGRRRSTSSSASATSRRRTASAAATGRRRSVPAGSARRRTPTRASSPGRRRSNPATPRRRRHTPSSSPRRRRAPSARRRTAPRRRRLPSRPQPSPPRRRRLPAPVTANTGRRRTAPSPSVSRRRSNPPPSPPATSRRRTVGVGGRVYGTGDVNEQRRRQPVASRRRTAPAPELRRRRTRRRATTTQKVEDRRRRTRRRAATTAAPEGATTAAPELRRRRTRRRAQKVEEDRRRRTRRRAEVRRRRSRRREQEERRRRSRRREQTDETRRRRSRRRRTAYGYTTESRLKENYGHRMPLKTSYGFSGRAQKKGSYATVVMASAAGVVGGSALGFGAYYAYTRYEENTRAGQSGLAYSAVQWCRIPSSRPNAGGTMDCTDCIEAYGSLCLNQDSCFAGQGCSYSMPEDTMRDDFMGTGFIPQEHKSPITIRIHKIEGQEFQASDICPSSSSTASAFVKASSLKMHLLASLSEMDVINVVQPATNASACKVDSHSSCKTSGDCYTHEECVNGWCSCQKGYCYHQQSFQCMQASSLRMKVSIRVILRNLDFDKVNGDSTTKTNLITRIKQAFIDILPAGYTMEMFTVTLSKGSVLADVDITPLTTSDAVALKSQLEEKKDLLDTAMATNVKAMPEVASLLLTGSTVEVASSEPEEIVEAPTPSTSDGSTGGGGTPSTSGSSTGGGGTTPPIGSASLAPMSQKLSELVVLLALLVAGYK